MLPTGMLLLSNFGSNAVCCSDDGNPNSLTAICMIFLKLAEGIGLDNYTCRPPYFELSASLTMKSNIDTVIENLIDASLGGEAEVRSRHVLREALRGLVRLAKSEQMLEIKTNVYKLTGTLTTTCGLRRSKASGAHDAEIERRGHQRQLEFNQNGNTQSDPGRIE